MLRRMRKQKFTVCGILVMVWFAGLTYIHFKNMAITEKEEEARQNPNIGRRPLYYLYGKNPDGGYLDLVKVVFENIGFERTLNPAKWDVLWAHDYPFTPLLSLGGHGPIDKTRLISKIPGSGFITNKINIGVKDYPFVPPSFFLPRDAQALKEFARRELGTMWVQKALSHRGVVLKSYKDLVLKKTLHDMVLSRKTFVQKYVANPMLIDNRKFDIGLYVTVTSVNPLRVYLHDSEILLRFCNSDYYPFDANDTGKYVVGGHYTPTWDIQALEKYYEATRSHKQSLFSYLRSKKKDPEKIWKQFRFAIRILYRDHQETLIRQGKGYPFSATNFFELVRFDFILDAAGTPFLMEVNMSPNLSSKYLQENGRLYEEVLMSTFSVTGLYCPIHSGHCAGNFFNRSLFGSLVVPDHEIMVFPEYCISRNCSNTCQGICSLCSRCLTDSQRVLLKTVAREHLHRGFTRRVLPSTVTRARASTIQDPMKHYEKLRHHDQLIAVWFLGKCLQDQSWCS